MCFSLHLILFSISYLMQNFLDLDGKLSYASAVKLINLAFSACKPVQINQIPITQQIPGSMHSQCALHQIRLHFSSGGYELWTVGKASNISIRCAISCLCSIWWVHGTQEMCTVFVIWCDRLRGLSCMGIFYKCAVMVLISSSWFCIANGNVFMRRSKTINK